MPDLDLTTADGPLRVYSLLHEARPALINLGEPRSLDIGLWADRVQSVDASYDGPWELPVIGEVDAARGRPGPPRRPRRLGRHRHRRGPPRRPHHLVRGAGGGLGGRERIGWAGSRGGVWGGEGRRDAAISGIRDG